MRKEGEYIRNIECVKKFVAGRTQKEYYDERRDVILKQKKQYAEDNKNKIREKNKEYYQENKEYKLASHKAWYEANKSHILQQRKEDYQTNTNNAKVKAQEYYERNKQHISESRKAQKFTCQCGSTLRNSDKSAHYKSKKHQNYLKQQDEKIISCLY